MSNWYNDDIRELLQAILTLETEDECRRFFQDLCSVKELIDMASRLQVAKLLKEKNSYYTVNNQTGVSSATISRVKRSLEYGEGGYQLVLSRLEEAGTR